MEMPEPFRECVSGIDAACHIPIADLLGRPEGVSRCTCRRSGARSVPTGGTVQGSPESRWVQGNPAEVSPSPTGDGSNGSAGGDRSEGRSEMTPSSVFSFGHPAPVLRLFRFRAGIFRRIVPPPGPAGRAHTGSFLFCRPFIVAAEALHDFPFRLGNSLFCHGGLHLHEYR
jgi:hypothetical protein